MVAYFVHFSTYNKVSLFNPILYMVNGFRYGFMGVTDVSITLSVGILLAFIAIFFGASWWLFKTGRGLRA